MREIERFEVRAEDGRTWRFALMQHVTTFQPLSGGTQYLPGPPEYVSLDAPGRYDIHAADDGTFDLVDLKSDAAPVRVTRS